MTWTPNLPARAPTADEVLIDVVEEHLDEAEYLLECCANFVDSPDYDATELATLPEERLRAHIDGLVLGGPVAIDTVIRPAIEDAETPHRAAAAALAMLDHPVAGHGEAALDEIRKGDEAYGEAIALALAWARRPDLDDRVRARISKAAGREAAVLLQSAASRGIDPGPRIGDFLRSKNEGVAAAAVAAAAYSRDPGVIHVLAAHAANPDEATAVAAIEGGISLGAKASWVAAQHGSRGRSRSTLQRVASFADPRQLQWLIGLLSEDAHREDALWALGFSGSPLAADACVDHMGDAAVAKLAGEAFRAITGLPYEEDEFWLEAKAPPEETDDDEDVLIDDDLDADLIPSSADELMTPDPETIAPWWKERRADFDDAVRYLHARPMSHAVVTQALREGCSMRRRHGLAAELSARTGGEQRLPTQASAGHQLELLAQLPGSPTDFQRPFTRWR